MKLQCQTEDQSLNHRGWPWRKRQLQVISTHDIVNDVQLSNYSKTASRVERRISSWIEARMGYLVLGGDPLRSTIRGAATFSTNFRFLILKKAYFCRLLSAKLKIRKLGCMVVDSGRVIWRGIHCQWANGLQWPPEGVEI